MATTDPKTGQPTAPATPAPTPAPAVKTNPKTGEVMGGDPNIDSVNQQLKTQNDYYSQLVESMKGAAADGPQLQYNPVQSMVRGTDGSLKPMASGYTLQDGEHQVGQLDDAYKLPGSDAYTNPLYDKQKLSESMATDKANQQSQGSLANAESQLTMRGGLNSANRANLVRANMHDSIAADQGVASQGMQDRANIGVQGAQMQQTADTTNLSNLLTSVGGVNQFNLDKYKQQMAVKAANDQAVATSQAGGSGGKK